MSSYVRLLADILFHRLYREGLIRVLRFGSKVGQVGPKRDKSGTFQDQFQYICAKTNLKKSQICLIWSQPDPFGAKPDSPWSYGEKKSLNLPLSGCRRDGDISQGFQIWAKFRSI